MTNVRTNLRASELESLRNRVDLGFLENKRILITGASGMLGSYLALAIVKGVGSKQTDNFEVTLLVRDRHAANLTELASFESVKIVECDLSEWMADKVYDVLIHAASPASPTKYAGSNDILSVNLGFLEKLAVSYLPTSILYVSSGEVYGAEAPFGFKETYEGEVIPNLRRSAYPLAKKSAEDYLLKLHGKGKTKVQIARLFHTFGPGLKVDDGRSFADFIWAAAKGKPIKLNSDGSAIRTFLYLEDAVAALLTILKKGQSGDIFNVGSERPITILEFARETSFVSGIPLDLNTPATAVTNYEHSPNKSIVPSAGKLVGLGWAEMTNLQDAIQRTIDWAKAQV